MSHPCKLCGGSCYTGDSCAECATSYLNFNIILNELAKQWEYIVNGCLVATQFIYGATFICMELSNNEIIWTVI